MEDNVFRIPLRVKKVERRNRAARAVREIKKFVRKQTEKDIKIDQEINDIIWKRGAQKPPSSIRVRLVDSNSHVLVQSPDRELPSEKKFECEDCGKTFSTEQGLKVHVSRAHREEEEQEEEEKEEENYVCEECDREFDTKRGLSIHQSQSHDEDDDDDDREAYEEALSGSISDAKEAIDNMDDPDFDLLLEIEEENKDRKGMKKYLEDQIS